MHLVARMPIDRSTMTFYANRSKVRHGLLQLGSRQLQAFVVSVDSREEFSRVDGFDSIGGSEKPVYGTVFGVNVPASEEDDGCSEYEFYGGDGRSHRHAGRLADGGVMVRRERRVREQHASTRCSDHHPCSVAHRPEQIHSAVDAQKGHGRHKRTGGGDAHSQV